MVPELKGPVRPPRVAADVLYGAKACKLKSTCILLEPYDGQYLVFIHSHAVN